MSKTAIQYPNGDHYVGELRSGKPCGQGSYCWSNGNTYVGSWVDGRRNGRGVFTWGPGSKWTGDRYEGSFLDDELHGKGTYYYANGDIYTGDWVNGRRHGRGTFLWRNGDRYDGDFTEGKRTGYGVLTWGSSSKSPGDRYEGQFVDGELCGKGTYYFAGDHCYEGDWVAGQQTGYGRKTNTDGSRQQGYWAGGTFLGPIFPGPELPRDSAGIYILPRSLPTFEPLGKFDDRKQSVPYEGRTPPGIDYCGKGILYRADGSLFEGVFKSSAKNGPGVLYMRSDRGWSAIEGQWLEDRLLTPILYTDELGRRFIADVEAGDIRKIYAIYDKAGKRIESI